MPSLVAGDKLSNVFFAFASFFSAAAKSFGRVTTRGAVSSSMSTSITSPPATLAPARFSALTPTMNRPPIEATVFRYVKPLIVTRTAGRFPAPRPSTTVDGTSKPVAVLPACSSVVRNLT